MAEAMALAEQAGGAGEVPVGAVVVYQQQIIGRGFNQVRALHDVSAHAEMQAIRAASRALGNYRLNGAALYCTLEPCVMCVGAIVHARIETLVFGAREPKTGACGSAFDLLSDPAHNHRVSVQQGVLAQTASQLLQRFFAKRREENNA